LSKTERRTPLPEIEAILPMLLELDLALKQGCGEPGLLLAAAVGEICGGAKAK
jgi:DNA polymerase III delta subunit